MRAHSIHAPRIAYPPLRFETPSRYAASEINSATENPAANRALFRPKLIWSRFMGSQPASPQGGFRAAFLFPAVCYPRLHGRPDRAATAVLVALSITSARSPIDQ